MMKTEKYLLEYQSLKGLYSNFSYTVKFILENLLRENNFKYQIVTCREKSEKSLKNKLKKLKNIKSVKDVNDLSGCRIIFYLDSDIKKVVKYLKNEFCIVKVKELYSCNSYNACHFIVKLDKDRLKLSEYKMFDECKCEVQLTTILNHAWSELNHDVIYKQDTLLSKFDERAFKSIKMALF